MQADLGTVRCQYVYVSCPTPCSHAVVSDSPNKKQWMSQISVGVWLCSVEDELCMYEAMDVQDINHCPVLYSPMTRVGGFPLLFFSLILPLPSRNTAAFRGKKTAK